MQASSRELMAEGKVQKLATLGFVRSDERVDRAWAEGAGFRVHADLVVVCRGGKEEGRAWVRGGVLNGWLRACTCTVYDILYVLGCVVS